MIWPTSRTGAFFAAMLIVGALCPGCLSAQEDPAQIPQATIRTEVSLVNIVFSALDRNKRPALGLKMEDFLVLEDKRPQKIEYFSHLTEGSDVPLTIAMLIDTSGSIRSKLEYEKVTAAEFLRGVLRRRKDQALVIQFDAEVRLIQD
ncbi:MAG: hypothetical protein HXY20_00665 [Acidobacteria bacterium]|nr:hypothetical protein [Acidobacteriota bacterium]